MIYGESLSLNMVCASGSWFLTEGYLLIGAGLN